MPYNSSEFTKELYSIGEASKFLGLSIQTLHSYEKKGKFKTVRTSGGHRRVSREYLLSCLDSLNMLVDDTNTGKKDIIYARISSHEQKAGGDLDRQAIKLIESFNELHNPLIIKEVGSGLNDKRKGLIKLLEMVMKNEIRNVYVTYKDRLTRFGFHYLEKVFANYGVNIMVLEKDPKNRDVQQELVDDMMSLIASFSGKLYRMRKNDKKA